MSEEPKVRTGQFPVILLGPAIQPDRCKPKNGSLSMNYNGLGAYVYVRLTDGTRLSLSTTDVGLCDILSGVKVPRLDFTPDGGLNGSGERNLTEPLMELYRKLNEAIETASQAMPHGRDYQLSGDCYEARRQWERFIHALTRARNEADKLRSRIRRVFNR